MTFKRSITLATLACLALVVSLFAGGFINLGTCLVLGVCVQCVAFSVAKPQARLFLTALTEEQVKEFKGILDSLKEYKDLFPSLKDLSSIEGGLAAIKTMPALIKAQQDLTDNLKSDLDKVRKAQLNVRQSSLSRPGEVSVECARHIGAIAIIGAEQRGRLEHLQASVRDSIVGASREILGIVGKTALSSTDIPLPTEYSGQVVELVSMWGAARKYGTVFPLGTGSVKLPRLKTDTAFGLLSQSVAVTETSPQTEWVTFTAEKFGGMIRVPSELDEDSIVPIGQFIARYCGRQIASVEDQVFFMNVNGSTYGAVAGLAGSTITNSKVTQMGSTKTHYSDATLANLRTLRSVPDAAALSTSAYYMHPSFEQLLSGLNTGGDKPYNPQAQIAGTGANPFTTGPTLDGFPIRWVDKLPAYSTSANVSKVFILFGDLSYQYLGVRGGIRLDTSREAAFATDEILIRGMERFTIGLMATGAIAGLETAAS